jgi:hypothetical protein
LSDALIEERRSALMKAFLDTSSLLKLYHHESTLPTNLEWLCGMEAIVMQLQLLGFDKVSVPSTYKLAFDYGGKQFDSKAQVCQGIAEYINYGQAG